MRNGVRDDAGAVPLSRMEGVGEMEVLEATPLLSTHGAL